MMDNIKIELENGTIKPLDKIDFKLMSYRQYLLDNKFEAKDDTKNEKNIIRISLALVDEIGELIHECKKVFDYWSTKDRVIDLDRTLSELSDIIHFLLSLHNELSFHYNVDLDRYDISDFEVLDIPTDEALLDLHMDISKYIIKAEDTFTILEKESLLEDIFSSILTFIKSLDVSEEEFLKVFHKVYMNNYNKRTTSNY